MALVSLAVSQAGPKIKTHMCLDFVPCPGGLLEALVGPLVPPGPTLGATLGHMGPEVVPALGLKR